ncbi:MAG TPA: hypothetical protein VD788_02750 [Candidatus Polarisedimenticolaceae bacterium]|nr:hypothetical protein [Candidatus Polarisedimenticolaceae bacterium]
MPMSNKSKRAGAGGDWRHLAVSGALLVAVGGTLLLGAVLEVPHDRTAAPRTIEAISPVLPADEPAEPIDDTVEPGMVVPFDGDADLVDRATDDERRLHASGNGYTLQFGVNCETKNVRANLEALDRYQDFYLLTMLYQDRACFRLCWGFYDNEAQARSDRRIPEQLLRMTDAPKVISVSEALP